MEKSSCTARVLIPLYSSDSVPTSRIRMPLWSTSRLVLRQLLEGPTEPELSRNMLLMDCEHSASPTGIYQSKSTRNGPRSMIRRRKRSMVAATRWIRRLKSLRRKCSSSVRRQLKTSCKKEFQMRFILSKWLVSRSGYSLGIAKRQLSILECRVD